MGKYTFSGSAEGLEVVEGPEVRVEQLVNSGRVRRSGCERVVDREEGTVELRGEHAQVHLVTRARLRHEAAAVNVEHQTI